LTRYFKLFRLTYKPPLTLVQHNAIRLDTRPQ
jgi:hypothetical protein